MHAYGVPVFGRLLVHRDAAHPTGLVASLRLGADPGFTFSHLRPPRAPETAPNGNPLLFQYEPRPGEASAEAEARRCDVYDSPQGPFALTPFGVVPLHRLHPAETRQAFDLDGLQHAIRMRRPGQAPPAMG